MIQPRLHIGVLYSRMRVEEKWIIAAMERRGVDYERLDDRRLFFDLDNPEPWRQFDAILERSISYTNGLYALRILNSWGIPTVNTAAVAEACGDKLTTSSALERAGRSPAAQPDRFHPRIGPAGHRDMGYPVVLKPVVGSWGRLLAKVNDRDAAEAVLEHKAILGSVQHSVFYIQEYIQKPGRDIRAFVVGDQTIYRHLPQIAALDHQHGARRRGRSLPGHPRARGDLHARGRTAVGGGVLAVDIIEHPERGLLVNEINHTMEFHTTQPLTGVDIGGIIIDYVIDVAQGKITPEGSRR